MLDWDRLLGLGLGSRASAALGAVLCRYGERNGGAQCCTDGRAAKVSR